MYICRKNLSMTKHIPNTITLLNLLCGCFAVFFAFRGSPGFSVWLIIFAGIFDFMDGMLARMLNAYSELGKQLDSLADVVSFGLAPSAIVFCMIEQTYIASEPGFSWSTSIFTEKLILSSAFLIALFSALRLAKFNIDTRQSTSFIGLPTPANAFFIISLIFWAEPGTSVITGVQPWMYSVIAIIFSGLLVAEIPMFSLKVKSLKWKENQIRYIFLSISILLAMFLHHKALTFIILTYIIISITSALKTRA